MRPPLSVRHDKAALESYQELHEGIPTWMTSGAYEWATARFSDWDDLQAAEQYFRLQLDWAAISRAARQSLIEDVGRSVRQGVVELLKTQGLDLLDYCLGVRHDWAGAQELESVLARSGSAWTVGEDHEGRLGLTRRVDETVLAAAAEEMKQRSNPSSYLRSAWHHVYGRNPNPSTAYHDAVRAVEAAVRPVVTPRDGQATLGRMIGALRDKPGKWDTVIGDVDTVRKMMATIWKSQFDRHGTDDTTKALNVSQSEAEAAVQVAVTLVQLFRTGAIRRIP